MMQNIYDDEEFFDKYIQLRNNPLSYNEILEMPVMKQLLPSVNSKDVLDIGCGMGKFIDYMLAMNPNSITGIDVSAKMIDYAKNKVTHENVEFIVSDLMAFNTYEKYDVIVSSLALHYIENYKEAVQKIYDLLKLSGTFIFSTEHPIQTATKQDEYWSHEPDEYDHYKMDHYFEESLRTTRWINKDVERYHRTISTLVNTLIDEGFTIERIEETGNNEHSLANWNDMQIKKVNHHPPFIVIKAQK